VIEVYGQKQWTSKYLRKCCVYFRTCWYTHHTCGYTRFYPKILSVWKLFKRRSYLLIFCVLLIDKLMNTCSYIGT
jgi:hypothetical protein